MSGPERLHRDVPEPNAPGLPGLSPFSLLAVNFAEHEGQTGAFGFDLEVDTQVQQERGQLTFECCRRKGEVID